MDAFSSTIMFVGTLWFTGFLIDRLYVAFITPEDEKRFREEREAKKKLPNSP